MRKFIAFMLFGLFAFSAKATHITGGEMYYTYDGLVNGQHQYSVTLKLYQRCNSGRQFPDPTIISIFDKATGTRFTDLTVPIGLTDNISINNPDPCITNPPSVCYDIAYYYFVIALPPSSSGWVLASEVNYRINGISNLGGGNIGATYTAEIPGNGQIADAPINNSAVFTGSDLVVICANNDFNYSFGADDPDGDQLVYSFCYAYNSTSNGGGGGNPTGPPPFPSVQYNFPQFDGMTPLGSGVVVNSNTGLITGVAPDIGFYVVTVCVQEIRNGVVIATQRKDIQVYVADCEVAAASLQPEYQLCGNTRTITFSNLSTSPLITAYSWQLMDPSGTVISSSGNPTMTYTFADTGTYVVSLSINPNQGCTDSASALVRVYPGFEPSFRYVGICLGRPTQFIDISTSVYGVINSWTWNFGEPTSSDDFSTQQNPTYTYPSMGIKMAELEVTDTKGCRGKITVPIDIMDKPLLELAFSDTLICRNDQVQLLATGVGDFTWTPGLNMSGNNTSSPVVAPLISTMYYVTLDDNGCRNTDSVFVKVVTVVSLSAMNDTTICSGDRIQLRIASDGLRFSWTPASQLDDATAMNPIAITPTTTTYTVTARIGGCVANESIRVATVPYPFVNAGVDTSICYNTPAQLRGSTDGNSWSWSPASSLSNPISLQPIARPGNSVSYILTAYDIRGCPKPGKDTVNVTVYPKLRVSAGRDTTIVIGQPLQLQGTGGEEYQWSPPTYLSDPFIANPVALFTDPSEGHRYKLMVSDAIGCRDSAYVKVKVYATGPTVFVPSAFTPNNDGRNDRLRPIAAGMRSIEYFEVYNRWGQLVFRTTVNGVGWDGRINGIVQATNTYVWQVKAVDHNGVPYFSKGVVTLIR